MASAMPPTTLFPRQYSTVGGSYAGENAAHQVQSDYLDMFNAMNPGGGGGAAPKGTVTPPGSPPTLSPPTMSISEGAMKTPIGGKGGTVVPGSGLPVYDTGKVAALTQQFAAPGIRNLRNTVQQVQQGYFENPNVKAQTLRDTLAGYGAGLENVVAGAGKTAMSEYGQEYGAEVQGALQSTDIAARETMQSAALASNEKLAQYNNEWKAYLASMR